MVALAVQLQPPSPVLACQLPLQECIFHGLPGFLQKQLVQYLQVNMNVKHQDLKMAY